MAMWGRNPMLVVISLLLSFGSAAALSEPEICYVLDGILFSYGIILTVLYCRVKVSNRREAKARKARQRVEEGIYTDLKARAEDTYESLAPKK